MTAKSSAGSSKTSPTRKKRSTPKTEQTVLEAVSDTQPRNDHAETTETQSSAKPARKSRAASVKNAGSGIAVKTRNKTKAATAEEGAARPTADKTASPRKPRAATKKSENTPAAPAMTTQIDGAPVKRGPGRPRKTPVAAQIAETAEAAPVDTQAVAEKPRRGRKPKAKIENTVEAALPAVETAPAPEAAEAPVPARKAGRPPRQRNAQRDAANSVTATSRKQAVNSARAKAATQDSAPETVSDSDAADTVAQNTASASAETAVVDVTPAPRAKRGRGRPKGQGKAIAKNTAPAVPVEATDATPTPADDAAMEAIIEAPKPLFSELGLSAPIMRAIEEMGYEHPTPIQARAIPVVLNGQDVLGVAQTGTGKTASFTLPMLEKLAGSRARARMPRSLILEPTRELALQVAENLTLYGKHLRLNHALLIGGESMADQRAVLNQGVDILIATPGRLMDLFDRGGLLLTQTGILVIDEADRMLDMGFIPDITRIVSMLPARRQTLLFSATMAPEIRTLADQFLHLPEEITVSRPSSVATTIEEALLVVDEHEKRRVLRKLLKRENVQNAIVFCNRKRDVDVLYKSLHKHGFAVGHLHGDLAQSLRFKTLERFKAGELQILVCSDVAARGIDIGGLSHVFNFDLPFNAEDYIHRIGRTGRAGKTGHAYSLASPRQKLLAEAIEKLKHAPIPMVEIDGIETLPWADPEQETGQPERHEKRGKDRGGRHNRHGESRDRDRDRDRDRPVSAERDRQAARPKPEATPERQGVERGSVAPTSAFDHDGPRTGFGHETPAFMLLPRRNRKAETEEHVGPIQHRGTV